MAKTKSAETADAQDLIAEVMAQATIDSGAAALPPPGEVPEARALGPVLKSVVPEVSETLIAASQHAAVLDLGEHCPPDVRVVAETMSNALQAKAPAPPPVQIGMGESARMMPSSVRTYPHELHTKNSPMAQQLWKAFLGEHKRDMAELAAQKGFVRHPFVFLSQAIWALIELDNWQPTKHENDKPFDPAEKEANNFTQRALVTAFGPDNARLVTRLAEHAGISILSALYHAYAQLSHKKQSLLHAARTTETVDQWAE